MATNQVLPFALLVLRPVRVRPRPRPRRPPAGHARPVLGGRPVLPAPRRPALVRRRDGRRRARRPAAVGRSTRPASSSARPPRSPLQLAGARGRARRRRRRPLRRADPGRGPAACSSRPHVAATSGLAAAGTLYGVLAAGLRVRETLLPLLLLPVVAPVLIGATPGLRGGSRHGDRRGDRGLAVGRPARRVRPGLHRASAWSPSGPFWRSA